MRNNRDEFLGTTSYLTHTGPHEGCDVEYPHQHGAAWWHERRRIDAQSIDEFRPEMTTVTFDDRGIPIVDHLEHDTISSGAIDYMRRYFIHRDYSTGATQIHHILTDDLNPDPHDHPWDFTSVLLTGAYRDIGPVGVVDHQAPCIVTRRAEHVHRLELLDGPMWTVVVAGPVRRQWGYHTLHGWMPWRDYRGQP